MRMRLDMIREENWKPIEGYEGVYEVSDLGNVRRYKKSLGVYKVLLQYTTSRGYKSVTLCNNGVKINKRVNRLVAEAFMPNLEGKDTVNHKDGNKEDNSVENLEWMTQAENNRHAHDTGLNKGKKTKQIIQYTLDGWLHNIFKSATEAARHLGDMSKQGNITSCCDGKKRTAYGFVWRYANGGVKA